MGHSQAEKAKTHEKILKLAAAQIREHGIDALGVAELMKDAGLTHGGFYVHFPSRDVLIAEALERALQSGPLANLGAGKSPSAFVRGYLSPEHRDGPASGCAISALSGEIRNSTPKTREILTKHLKERFQIMTEKLGGTEGSREEALTAMSTMVGALTLARAVDDEQLSDEILRAARRTLIEAIEGEASKPRRRKRVY
jgi:TetR/AcrR family transcriptional repressor of nem operon